MSDVIKFQKKNQNGRQNDLILLNFKAFFIEKLFSKCVFRGFQGQEILKNTINLLNVSDE